MGATPLPVDPFAIFDISEMNGQLASVTVLYAASIPATVSVLPAAAVVAGGAYLETKLLQNEQWDNFWIKAGGKLNDVWHSVTNSLFGHGDGITKIEAMGAIRLGMHVTMRATRQLLTSGQARTAAVTGALYKGVIAVANTVRNLTDWTRTNLNALAGRITAGDNAVRNYVDGKIVNLSNGVAQRIGDAVGALRADIYRDALVPIGARLQASEERVQRVLDELHRLEDGVAHDIGPRLDNAALIAGAALALGKAAKAWEEDCGEPMCQTMGPKTDLGKLLKRADVAAMLALLAAVAALDPDDVEGAAVAFGRMFGPVLSRWAEGWIGITNDAVGDVPGKVAHEVGGILGGIIP